MHPAGYSIYGTDNVGGGEEIGGKGVIWNLERVILKQQVPLTKKEKKYYNENVQLLICNRHQLPDANNMGAGKWEVYRINLFNIPLLSIILFIFSHQLQKESG